MSYRKMMKWNKCHPSGGKCQYLGFSALGQNERRGMPQYGLAFIEKCLSDKSGEMWKASLREWELETRRLLALNPSLIIIGERPHLDGEDSL